MSGRNWGQLNAALAALLAIVVAGIFAWAIWDIAFLTAKDSLKAEQRASQHRADTDKDIQSACIGLDPAAFAVCVREKVEASHEYQRTERDLAAQRGMARYAGWMLVISALSVLVTAVGVYYVRHTLEETRAANRIARDTGEAQVRAYISVVEATIRIAEMKVKIRNSGNSPAKQVMIWPRFSYHGLFTTTQIQRRLANKERIPGWGKDIPAGLEETFTMEFIDFFLSAENLEQMNGPYGLTVEVIMTIDFEDVFGTVISEEHDWWAVISSTRGEGKLVRAVYAQFRAQLPSSDPDNLQNYQRRQDTRKAFPQLYGG